MPQVSTAVPHSWPVPGDAAPTGHDPKQFLQPHLLSTELARQVQTFP